MAILVSNKIDFRTIITSTDKKGPCIMIKISIRQEDKIIVNGYMLITELQKT